MLRQRFSMLLFAAALLTGCAKVIVVPVPKTTPANGVIYALPNTVIRVQLKVDQTKKSGARYSLYAAIFAPDGDPVCKDEKCTAEKRLAYSLQQGSTFSTYGEPDPTKVFLVKFAGRGAIDQTLSMTWNEAGLLSAASSSVTNRTSDVVMSGLKLAAVMGTKAALGTTETRAGTDVCPGKDNETDTDGWVIPALQKAGAPWDATLTANYCDISKDDRAKLGKPDPPDTLDKRKALLADAVTSYVNQVAPLAGGRLKILNGTSTSMEPATLLAHIEAEINQQLTALFLGTKKTLTWDGAVDVRTMDDKTVTAGTPLSILRIDRDNGICVKNSEVPPDAKPIPKEFVLPEAACQAPANPLALNPAVEDVNLVLNYYPDADKQLFKKITDVTTGDRSFRYRIPAQVKANLSGAGKTYGSGVFSVAQIGTMISLPANRHTKMLSYDLGFIEATGGLKTFKLGTTGGLDSATVDALSSVGGTLIDARNTARKNADDLTVLTRQDALLKLRDDICTIQKKYGLACTVEPQ
jgi:hypothetical protein